MSNFIEILKTYDKYFQAIVYVAFALWFLFLGEFLKVFIFLGLSSLCFQVLNLKKELGKLTDAKAQEPRTL